MYKIKYTPCSPPCQGGRRQPGVAQGNFLCPGTYLLDTDHISFLQRRSGTEFFCLTIRMNQCSPVNFGLSVVSLHEQVLGAHNFINRVRTNIDLTRGYSLLSEILQGFASAPIVPFDAEAIAIFDELRA